MAAREKLSTSVCRAKHRPYLQVDFDDHNQQPDDDDEGEEESPKDPKGKKRAALGDGGAPRKRGRTD